MFDTQYIVLKQGIVHIIDRDTDVVSRRDPALIDRLRIDDIRPEDTCYILLKDLVAGFLQVRVKRQIQ